MDSMLGMRLPDVERWSDRVVVVRGRNPGLFTGPGTNTFLVGTGPRPLLIDTGAGVPAYLELLDEALEREWDADAPAQVLVTHVHPDHLGGAASVLARFGPLDVRKQPWPGRDEAHAVTVTPLAPGDVVRTEGATLRALPAPGHAQDHLCFLLEEEGALFTGDVVLGAGTTVISPDGGDMAAYLDTLARLRALGPSRLYPGHGPLIDDAQGKLDEYLEHRLRREALVLEALARGPATVPEIVERVYADTPRVLHKAAALTARSHLAKLEAEGRARRDGERWTRA